MDFIRFTNFILKGMILLAFCQLLTMSVQAQGFRGGVHLGLLATQVDGDNHSGFKKAGFFGGVFTNITLSNAKMQFQFELNYAQKGSAAKPVYRIALQQVEPTVLFGWECVSRLMLEAGLSGNVLASAKEYVNQVQIESEMGSRFYLFHVDVVGGLRYRLSEHWGVGLRYAHSASPIGTTNRLRVDRPVEGCLFNSSLLFRLYYQIR